MGPQDIDNGGRARLVVHACSVDGPAFEAGRLPGPPRPLPTHPTYHHANATHPFYRVTFSVPTIYSHPNDAGTLVRSPALSPSCASFGLGRGRAAFSREGGLSKGDAAGTFVNTSSTFTLPQTPFNASLVRPPLPYIKDPYAYHMKNLHRSSLPAQPRRVRASLM